jgi:hypothetical protein
MRALVCEERDPALFKHLGAPHATSASWIRRGPRSVVSAEVLALDHAQLQAEVLALPVQTSFSAPATARVVTDSGDWLPRRTCGSSPPTEIARVLGHHPTIRATHGCISSASGANARSSPIKPLPGGRNSVATWPLATNDSARSSRILVTTVDQGIAQPLTAVSTCQISLGWSA